MEILNHKKAYPFLVGGGETGNIIAKHNWSSTSLGSIDQWPLSLRTVLGNLLHSAFPMFLFWGKELFCFYNDAYRPSLGNNGKHPAIGLRAQEVWPEIWDFIGPMIQRVLETGEAEWYENRLVPIYRNGKIEDVYWTFSYSPAYDDHSTISGMLVTCVETTDKVVAQRKIEETVAARTAELKQAHAALLEANLYLQDIINNFKEPMQVLHPVIENNEIVDFKYKLTNLAYSSYAQTTPDKLENKRVGEVFPGYFQTSSFLKVKDAYLSGKPDTWDIHYDKDGLDLYNQMSATKLKDDVVVHFTDFTKLKYLELELLAKIKELERSNGQLEEFAHAASHDLKEPIRKILIFSAMLKETLRNKLIESELQLFEKIESSIRRMVQLVDDLLLFSHVTEKPHQKEDVDLNDCLNQIVEDLELHISQKQAVIETEKLPVVKGYRRQLQQLLQNLVSNALKYSHDDLPTRVKIDCKETHVENEQFHLLQISDNGIGFEQQHSERIFQMFTRLHAKGKYSGTGIGLSIAKKIVDNHEGKIAAESIPGQGSVFRIWLPAK